LATNQQLKKQLLVKNVLVTHTAGGLVEEVNRAAALIPNWQDSNETSPIIELRQGLEQLAQGHENGQATYYDLVLVLESVLTAWKDDLAKAGIELEVNLNTKQRCITLNYFNLDIVFNSLVASVIKRNFKSQRMLVSVEEINQQLVVTLRDFGMPFPKWTEADPEAGLTQSTDLNIEKLPLLIHQSGGQLKTFISDSQNVVQLSWPIEYQVTQKVTESTLEQIETIKHPVLTQEQMKLSAEQEWKNRVALLVGEQYSDAEFGTASAARLLFMSERSLQRRFKSAFDKTFKEYLNQVRLEHACERLLAGEKVSDVAFNSGFNDPSYFSQRFKHHFGMSPSKFAENADD
jgi:AraC family chitin signaling transcriptional activator